MSEPLDLFSAPDERPSDDEHQRPMSPEQREEIRALFSTLGIAVAQEQFGIVDALIGVRLQSVTDLDSKNAGVLIPRLRKRVESRQRTPSGNSWNDREEDTWIDNL
ncbi:hypothetical protein [Microbacterium phyllosphaerae]|uniref:hypothetical protein n=1 Tax=Microbacterium phyllosphaerae TaxID=124798 RepID=UPI0021698C15|nr:hypothetical protein [Microbacterium phyllosphaerae]MCS3442811.1 DNA polymerase-3 subunit epsilon [Microbacterium phyllosphaerae]